MIRTTRLVGIVALCLLGQNSLFGITITNNTQRPLNVNATTIRVGNTQDVAPAADGTLTFEQTYSFNKLGSQLPVASLAMQMYVYSTQYTVPEGITSLVVTSTRKRLTGKVKPPQSISLQITQDKPTMLKLQQQAQ